MVRRYEVVVQDITAASYDITVWRDEDGQRTEVFGEPVLRYTGPIRDAADERLRAGYWRRVSDWQDRDGVLVAEVEPVT